VRETFKAMAPMLFALAVFQVNTFLDQVLAEALIDRDGAVSSFNYASRLFQFPLGLVSVALGTAMFPLMSRFAAQNQLERLTASLLNSVRLLTFIAVPAALGLGVLAYPVVELLFSGPRSAPEELRNCALVVAMLCISLPIVSVISLLTKAFFALRDHRTPTRIALVAVAVNLIANVILLQTPLQEAGLAVGTAISGVLNLALLAWLLRKRLTGTVLQSARVAAAPQVSERLAQPFTPSALRAFPLSLARSLFVAALMGAAAYGVERAIFGAFEDPTRAVRALSVGGAVVAGVALYALLSLLLRAPEMGQILTLRRRRAG
jgi:peptidoglycan biosynthesis protein MviN/MurJ (putative lipid II flippase)